MQLLRHQLKFLNQTAEFVQPVEACAILFGKLSPNKAAVEKISVVQNRLNSNTRFEVDPEDVAAAVSDAEKEGLDFVGLFHSHPAPANPSMVDLKFMKLWGDALWLILSLTDNVLAAYQLVNGELKQVPISIK